MKQFLLQLTLCGVIVQLVSCAKPLPPVTFDPNSVIAHGTELAIGYSMEQALAEAQVALTELFGTPDDPKLPDFLDDDLKALVSMEHLVKASGPPGSQGRGIYRTRCASCHGITGNALGVNAALSNPYPRDFRMGKFKFKSTARGAKPLKEDLKTTIANGIAGTTMVPIKELTDEDITALVDYVIYLSWRGEVERELLRLAEDIEFDSEDPETLKNLYAPGSFRFGEEQVPQVREVVTAVGQSWLEAENQIKTVPDPGDIPIHATLEELNAASSSSLDSPLKASITRGRELFVSEQAGCSKCHGPQGHGDGQTQDYDDWTKDWTIRFGLDPADEKKLIPLMARGAFPPRRILPRDFREGVYRGGSDPEKIFHRISYGIDGTPMPAVEGTVAPEDIWHLVNFVRSLARPEQSKK